MIADESCSAQPFHGPLERFLFDAFQECGKLAEVRKELVGFDTWEAMLSEQEQWTDLGAMKLKRLREAACLSCGSKRTIGGRWPKKGAPCPNCGQVMLVPARTWIS
jgi:predicted RNA-binding Zn-ribbon protein involved in translation (DUF1610 family)